MALLPSISLTRALSYVPASSLMGAPPAPPSVSTLPPRDPTLEERKREDRRVQKWGRMLVQRHSGGDISNWTVNPRKEGKLVSRVYKGVPDRWRSAAWWILIERRAIASQAGKQAAVAAATAAASGVKAATRDPGSLGRQYRVSVRCISEGKY